MAEEEVRRWGSSDALVAILELASLSKLVVASLPQQRIKLLPRGEFGAVQVGLALNVAGQPRMEARIGTRH